MNTRWQYPIVILFLTGFLLAGMLGTGTAMTFVWPAYLALSAAAAASIATLFVRTHFEVPRWCLVSLFAACAWFLGRAATSPISYFAREDAALVVTGFLAYAVTLYAFASGPRRLLLVATMAGVVALQLAYALAQRMIDPSIWLFPGYERTVADRIGGLFNHPAHLGAYLAATAPLFGALALSSKRSPSMRVALGTLVFVSLATIVATGSLAALVAALAGLLLVGLLASLVAWPTLSASGRRGIWVPFVCVATALAAVAALHGRDLARTAEGALLERGGGIELVPIWKLALDQAAQSPVAGTGSRTFHLHQRLHRSADLGATEKEPEFVHNEYLQALADYGAVGLALLLVLLAVHALSGFRFVRAYAGFGTPGDPPLPQSDHLGLTMGALGSIGALALLACTDFVLHLPLLTIHAAILLALLACPDPMSRAARKPKRSLLPGGAFLFTARTTAFGCGLAMLVFGSIFTRSEWHYEKARLAFETDPHDYRQFRHLQWARRLDPANPFALSLSGHAHAAAVRAGMDPPVREEALHKANRYFEAARELYPQDIYAAVGHAAVLSALGRQGEALERIAEARRWAPGYGNLMLAEAEIHLRSGHLAAAEEAYRAAETASAFRVPEAARIGLALVAERRNRGGPQAEQDALVERSSGEEPRRLLEAKVEEISVGADAGGVEPAPREDP